MSANLWKVPFDPVSGTVRGEPTPVTEGTRSAYNVAPSPNGNWLVYVSFTDQEDIFIMRKDGTGRLQLTDDLARDKAPRWFPDGTTIAFYSNRSGSYEIWAVQKDGSRLRRLTATPGQTLTHCAWSPDGSQLAYNNWSESTVHIFDPGRPWEEQTPLTLPRFGDEQEGLVVCYWSPDGLWLTGDVRSQESGRAGIAIFSLETQTYRRLTVYGAFPVWLSDSQRLLFNHEGKIHLVDKESGQVHEVLSVSPDRIGTEFSVSQDNRWIYFTHLLGEADIWMLTLNEERE